MSSAEGGTAVGAVVSPPTVGAPVKEISLDPAVGPGVGAPVKEMSRDPAVGAGVAAITTGAGVNVPGTITQGASPHDTFAAAMVPEQQSVGGKRKNRKKQQERIVPKQTGTHTRA